MTTTAPAGTPRTPATSVRYLPSGYPSNPSDPYCTPSDQAKQSDGSQDASVYDPYVVTRAAIYTRVSLDRAAGRSVGEQEAECRRWVEREDGWQLVGKQVWCDNSISASRYAKRGRQEWAALAEVIDAGDIDVLVA